MPHKPEPWDNYGTIVYVGEGKMPRDEVARCHAPLDAKRIVACVNALQGVENPEEFMRHLRSAMRWLGRAESKGPVFGQGNLLEELRAAAKAAGNFEEYT